MKKCILKKKTKKPQQFHNDISEKRKGGEEMRLQTDQEFQQNDIKKLNTEFDISMFSTRVTGGEAFVAEQKIREYKKLAKK